MVTAVLQKEKLLEVKGLQTFFYTEEGTVKAVDGLSYHVDKGECVGLVGESACGKSVSAMSVLRLITNPPGVLVGGEILFNGEDLLQASEARMRDIRGNHIAMIFQEPTTSLNQDVLEPVTTEPMSRTAGNIDKSRGSF
jgi:ABC-type dipeptide/oligopeptide/nickel transport system ATPase component